MKALRTYLLIALVGLALSCKKKEYPPSETVNDVVYKFSASIDNQPVSLSAGLNNYYMYSSYAQDTQGVYNFSASLRQIGCSGGCANSLKIKINDFKISPWQAPVMIDSALYPRSQPFLEISTGYQVQFQSAFNKAASAYSWNFGDGSTSDLANPTHVYARPGNYPVSLKISNSSGCQSIIRQTQKITDPSASFVSYIMATDSSAHIVRFNAGISGGRAPYQYLWSFGDGSTSSQPGPNHYYAVIGSYPVSVKITDSNNETVTAEYNAVTQTDLSSCAANYKLAGPVTPIPYSGSAYPFSKITVNWVDANGVEYSSAYGTQPAGSHFQITSVEDGGLNENNEPIKKLHILFNCTVFNGSHSLAITNADAVVSVAYKN